MPATWHEVARGVCNVVNLDNTGPNRSLVLTAGAFSVAKQLMVNLNPSQTHFPQIPPAPRQRTTTLPPTTCLSVHLAQEPGSRNRRRWATGCVQGPIYVAVRDVPGDDDEDVLAAVPLLAAQVFCFVRVDFDPRSGVTVPTNLRLPDKTNAVDVAIVRWLEVHPRCRVVDRQGRGVCPGLPVNHALWSYAADRRPGFELAHIRAQLGHAGVAVDPWVHEYGASMFDVVPTSAIEHFMNVGVDPDVANGLLETISMPGMQTD